MGQTLVEKIISNHAGKSVKAGELVIAKVDVCAVQDGTGPLTVQEFKKLGKDKLKNPERTILFIDHASPSPKKELSNMYTTLRDFRKNMVQFSQKLAPEFATKDLLKLLLTLLKSWLELIHTLAHQEL